MACPVGACQPWCANPCKELTGSIHDECSGCTSSKDRCRPGEPGFDATSLDWHVRQRRELDNPSAGDGVTAWERWLHENQWPNGDACTWVLPARRASMHFVTSCMPGTPSIMKTRTQSGACIENPQSDSYIVVFTLYSLCIPVRPRTAQLLAALCCSGFTLINSIWTRCIARLTLTVSTSYTLTLTLTLTLPLPQTITLPPNPNPSPSPSPSPNPKPYPCPSLYRSPPPNPNPNPNPNPCLTLTLTRTLTLTPVLALTLALKASMLQHDTLHACARAIAGSQRGADGHAQAWFLVGSAEDILEELRKTHGAEQGFFWGDAPRLMLGPEMSLGALKAMLLEHLAEARVAARARLVCKFLPSLVDGHGAHSIQDPFASSKSCTEHTFARNQCHTAIIFSYPAGQEQPIHMHGSWQAALEFFDTSQSVRARPCSVPSVE